MVSFKKLLIINSLASLVKLLFLIVIVLDVTLCHINQLTNALVDILSPLLVDETHSKTIAALLDVEVNLSINVTVETFESPAHLVYPLV